MQIHNRPLLKMYINIYAYISTLTVRCKHSFLISIRPKNLFKIFCLSHKNHKMNAKKLYISHQVGVMTSFGPITLSTGNIQNPVSFPIIRKLAVLVSHRLLFRTDEIYLSIPLSPISVYPSLMRTESIFF